MFLWPLVAGWCCVPADWQHGACSDACVPPCSCFALRGVRWQAADIPETLPTSAPAPAPACLPACLQLAAEKAKQREKEEKEEAIYRWVGDAIRLHQILGGRSSTLGSHWGSCEERVLPGSGKQHGL